MESSYRGEIGQAVNPTLAREGDQLVVDLRHTPGDRRSSQCRPVRRSAPASISSAASHPDADAPDADDRQLGSAWRTSKTARTATGWIARPDKPPPPLPSTGRRVSGSSTRPSSVLISVTASAPAVVHRPGDVDDPVGVRAQFRPPRAADIPRSRPSRSAESSASWAKMLPRPSRFGHDRLTSTATTSTGASASRSAACAVVVDRTSPDAAHDRRTGLEQRRQLVIEPVLDARPLQADGVDHALRRRMHARRRVARPLERRRSTW